MHRTCPLSGGCPLFGSCKCIACTGIAVGTSTVVRYTVDPQLGVSVIGGSTQSARQRTGVTVILCVSPGYTCPRTYIPRETRSREHISLKLHFLSVTVIYVSPRYVFPPEKRLWAVNTERC